MLPASGFMLGTTRNTTLSRRERPTVSVSSSRRCSRPSISHSAMVSPGCWRPITQMFFFSSLGSPMVSKVMSLLSSVWPRVSSLQAGAFEHCAEDLDDDHYGVRREVREITIESCSGNDVETWCVAIELRWDTEPLFNKMQPHQNLSSLRW